MRPLMYLQIFGASEQLSTTREGARERLLTSVYTQMVDQLVFSFECHTSTLTILPEANVFGRVVEADMVLS